MTSSQVARRILMHERARNVLTIGGIFVSILMIFPQLGFYSSVPKAGMLIYNHLRFDIILTSSSYAFQEQACEFPRQRLYEALAISEVQSAAPTFISSPRSPSRRTGGVSEAAPLARRNLVAEPRRLARSIAVLLMMLQLGFRDGYIESMLLMMRRLDGDIMLVNSQMYQFERAASFPRRQLAAARGGRRERASVLYRAREGHMEELRGSPPPRRSRLRLRSRSTSAAAA